MNKTNRNISVDVLKLILSFFIIGLHFNFLADIHPYLGFLFTEGISRIGVPIFLIISGFYYVEKPTLKEHIPTLLKLFSLYLFWMLIYFFAMKSENKWPEKAITYIFGYFHLWYLLATVLGLILLHYITKTKIGTLLFFTLAITGIFLQLENNYPLFELKFCSSYHWYRNAFCFAFPFLYVGYFIKKEKLTEIEIGYPTLLLTTLLLVVEVNLHYFFTYKAKTHFDILLSLYFICPVLFIKASQIKMISTSKIIASLSTGVYLVHVLVYYYVNQWFMCKKLSITSSYKVMLSFILSLFISYFLIVINKKLKWKFLV